jgi:tetratricopeptide (TPR) repeat protein
MKKSLIMIAALAFSLALFAPLTSAATIVAGLVAQDPTPEEAAAYKAWFEANNLKDYPKAMELAKAYLEKFPNGKYADYLKNKWAPGVRGMQFKEAATAKNVPEVIRIGKEVLAADPENLDYLSALVVQIRTNELFANPPNFAHAAEAADFAERAIRLIEAGKTPTGADPKTFNKNVTLAYMHQTLAVIYEHDKNIDKALAEYEKAAALEPSNPTYYFHCGRLHNDKYAAAAQKYQTIPEADRDAADAKPEVKAALEEVNKQADAVITCWARFLGLTVDKKDFSADTRAKIEKALTDLYKYRHNDSTDGLQKLIDQNRTTPPAGAVSSASAATKP